MTRRLARSALLLVTLVFFAAAIRPASAQDAAAVTVTLTASTAKAKVGDIVYFTIDVQNTGTETINLFFSLGLPDALDARAASCPGDHSDSAVTCVIDEFTPGSTAEGVFYVYVGRRTPNGPISASAGGDDIPTVFTTIPALKIVGSPHR